MARPFKSPGPLVIILSSIAILVHLVAVTLHALAAPSGPWPGMEGMNMGAPPVFARALDEPLGRYLKPLRLDHTFHYAGNSPMAPGVFLEVRLKDAKKETIKTVRLPEPGANAWVRNLETLFVRELVPDRPVMPPQGELVPAPHQQVRTVPIWDVAGEERLQLRETPEHLIPRNRQVFGPSDWSLVLVRSYARYLCRQHGAASAEVLRHSRETIPASALLMGPPPPAAFNELVVSYGDISGE